MLNLGRLKWIMDADDSRFNRKMGKAERRIRTLKRTAVAAVAGMGGAAAVTGAAGTASQLAKTARGTGLKVGTLQEMYYAGERAGIGKEDMRSSLTKFTRRMGYMREGKGTMAQYLKTADPQLMKRMQGAGVDQGIGMFAGAYQKMGASQRAAFAHAAGFGGGIQVASLFGGGNEQLSRTRQQGRRRRSMYTGAEARGAEVFEDTWSDIKGLPMSVASRAATNVGGAATSALQAGLEAVLDIRDWMQNSGGGSVGP